MWLCLFWCVTEGEKNHLVSKVENIKTTFIFFMTATPMATLDNKPVHLDSYSTEDACIWYDWYPTCRQIHCYRQSNVRRTGKQMYISHLRKRGKKRENLVMVTLNAAAFLASIWDPGGISAGSGSWGCTYDGWLILWDRGPCRCTTAIKQKSNHQSDSRCRNRHQ